MAKKLKAGLGDAAAAKSMEAALSDGAVAEVVGTRCMVTLPAGDIHLLDTACLVDGMDRSAVVSRLIREHLSKYFSGKHAASSPTAAAE